LEGYEASDATQGKWVAYMQFGKSKETGVISSRNAKFVFVKFDTDLTRFGWKGTTPWACGPKDPIELPRHEHRTNSLSGPPDLRRIRMQLQEDLQNIGRS
jgi:hypothetical protein